MYIFLITDISEISLAAFSFHVCHIYDGLAWAYFLYNNELGISDGQIKMSLSRKYLLLFWLNDQNEQRGFDVKRAQDLDFDFSIYILGDLSKSLRILSSQFPHL